VAGADRLGAWSLYVAAACFAIGIGVLSPVASPRNVTFSVAVLEPVLVVLWGLTFGGWALVLWPLAFFTHRLVWNADRIATVMSGAEP